MNSIQTLELAGVTVVVRPPVNTRKPAPLIASLAKLNSRLEKPIPMNRFRPNLVVTGCEPFSEDNWYTVGIGNVVFNGVKLCRRCVITTVDQATGNCGKEPLLTLATFRRVSDGIIFGQNLVHAGVGELQVGNSISLTEF